MNVVYICRMDIDPDKLLPYLTQVEEVAEDILSDKQQLMYRSPDINKSS
jgi:hypothetical protein